MGKQLVQQRNIIEFLWVDGRSAAQVMARSLVKKLLHTTKKVEDIDFLRVRIPQSQFIVAGELHKLIGSKNTTKIKINNSLLVNKGQLARVFECYRTKLRSRAKNYCLMKIESASAGDFTINVHKFKWGMRTTLADPPAKRGRAKSLFHPCKTCYYATYPRPASPKEWQKRIVSDADRVHASICPAFTPKIKQASASE